jgi:hypothetical protein
MSEQFQSGGVIITFFCGPNQSQRVEIFVLDRRQELTIAEFLDLMIPALSEANRRRSFELQRQRDAKV